MSRVLRCYLHKYDFIRLYKALRSNCANILPVDKRNDFMSLEPRCAHTRVPLIAWKVATVVWALVIFSLSTGGFGPSFTEPLLAGALGLFHLTISKAGFEVFHFCVRKAAHLAEYAVFAALLCASSKEPQFPWRPRRVLGCFLIAVVYSLTDEYHQSFVPGRNASLTDCGIDAIGAALGILAYSVRHIRLRTLGLCGTGILPVLTPGQDGHATIPSGGQRLPLQIDRIVPIPSRDEP